MKVYRDSVTRFFASDFFHESVSSQPYSIPLGPFWISWKFAEIFASQGAPPVSTTPVANLPLVSTTSRQILPRVSLVLLIPVANNGNLKTKIYIFVNSTTQRCPNKKFKYLWLKFFSICHQCQWHQWCTLSCEYPANLATKFEMALMVYSGAWRRYLMLAVTR